MKKQLIIFFVLLLILFCQKLVIILGTVVNGSIPLDLILSLLGTSIPKMTQLIFPLSLFLGIIFTLNRMLYENEIIIIYSCGLGKHVFIIAVLILSLMTSLLITINVIWISPWSLSYQSLLISRTKTNFNITTTLVEGQFKLLEGINSVVFVKNIDNQKFKHIFLAQLNPKKHISHSVTVADNGYIKQLSNGMQAIILNNGICYEGTAQSYDFRITYFTKYKAIISNPKRSISYIKDVEQMSVNQLWKSLKLESIAELNWRLTLIISVFIIALIILPLSINDFKFGRLNAMILYLIFFMIQTLLRFNGVKEKMDYTIWVWLINLIYLIIALILNLWDSALVCKLRFKFIKLKTIS